MKAIVRRLLLIPFALVAAGAALSVKGEEKDNTAVSLGGYRYIVPGEGKIINLYEEKMSDLPYETSVTVADYGIRSFSMPMGEDTELKEMLSSIYEDAKPESYEAAGLKGYLVTGDSKAFIWADENTMYVIQCWGPDKFCNMVFESIERIDTVRQTGVK